MRFQIFRFFLATTTQSSLFSDKKLSRKEIMYNSLKKETDYDVWGLSFSYIPELVRDEVIVAKIGKKSAETIDVKSKRSFSKEEQETWPNRYVIFDLNKQLIAFEDKNPGKFGSVNKRLKDFIEMLNDKFITDFGWRVQVEAVSDENDFWKFVEENKLLIESIEFKYNVPNLWGVNDDLEADLKTFDEVYSAQTVTTELKNEDGNLVVPQTPFMNQSVQYTTRGGGKYKVKLTTKKVLDSSNSKKVVTTENELESNDPELLERVAKEIFSKC